jgi:hypothetical protein
MTGGLARWGETFMRYEARSPRAENLLIAVWYVVYAGVVGSFVLGAVVLLRLIYHTIIS